MIRKATTDDLPQMLAIFERARAYMAQNGNPSQWGDGYPKEEQLRQDIARGVSYVLEADGQLDACFAFIIGEDPTYLRIDDGAWRNDEPYGTIHRLASAGNRSGVATQIFDWCSAQIRNLRADTHNDNLIMQHLLEKYGFLRCGTIYVRDLSPRIAYHFVARSGDEICTYSHVIMNPLQAKPEEIRIEDIAHALSLMTRANGHFPTFYSVGQHCLSCMEEARARGYERRLVLACLLHDAAEAYLSDLTRPVKHHMDYYIETEHRLLGQIYVKFLGSDLNEEEEAFVKSVDDTMLYHEFYHFMKVALFSPAPQKLTTPDYSFAAFEEVEKKYLEAYRELSGD